MHLNVQDDGDDGGFFSDVAVEETAEFDAHVFAEIFIQDPEFEILGVLLDFILQWPI